MGRMPLPPYVRRFDLDLDKERYQTVYARHTGAIAAPTAGLHFDITLLERLKDKGVNITFITLHVGLGTFQSVRTQRIAEHVMHAKTIRVSEEVCNQIKQTKKSGKRIVAVGTTSVRSLETAAASGEIRPFTGETRLFIYPGYSFRCVDVIVTNFHLSQSTPLMLVCAFAGYNNIMSAYHEAIAQQYRLFSYGDAMWPTR